MKSSDYKKLSPTRLRELGLSPKAEQYENDLGHRISKRRYQELKLKEKHGKKITLAQRAKNYLRGIWQYATEGLRKAALGRRKKPVSGEINAEDMAILAKLRDSRGHWTEKQKRQMKNFIKKYTRNKVLEIVSPELYKKAA